MIPGDFLRREKYVVSAFIRFLKNSVVFLQCSKINSKMSDEGVQFILHSVIYTLPCHFEEIDYCFVTNAADKLGSSGVIGDKEG